MIFRDNEAARSFQISLKWITQCMILISFILVTSGISFLAAFQYYRIANKTDPSHVQDLEEELTAVKLQLKSLESISIGTPSHSITANHHSVAESIANGDHSHVNPPLLIFPTPTTGSAPASAPIPFTIEALNTSWATVQKGVSKTLKVHFAIQYQKNDQGSQQGRILVLARGSAGLFTYPSDVMSSPGPEGVISVEKGEFFSVSRYRQVNADFGPLPANSDLTYVEIFIFSKTGQILTYQKVHVEKSSGTFSAAKSHSAKMADTSSETQAPEKPHEKLRRSALERTSSTELNSSSLPPFEEASNADVLEDTTTHEEAF